MGRSPVRSKASSGGRGKKVAAVKKIRMSVADLERGFAVYNPQEIDDAALSGLGSTLEEFGYVELVVWNDARSTVVGGHKRIRLLKEQGYTHVDVSVVEIPDLIREKALNVALNNPRIRGRFTKAAQSILAEIDDVKPDLSKAIRFDALAEDLKIELGELKMPTDQITDPSTDPVLADDFDYRVMVMCKDEKDQAAVYERLTREGLECKLLTV